MFVKASLNTHTQIDTSGRAHVKVPKLGGAQALFWLGRSQLDLGSTQDLGMGAAHEIVPDKFPAGTKKM